MSNENHKHNIPVMILSVIGVLVSLYLVFREFFQSGYCPPLIGIPTCYLTLILYMLVLFSTIKSNIKMFNIGVFSALVIAIWFTYNHLSGLRQCPILFGIPLCYGSLILAIALLIAKRNSYE
jgi:hypothetical protein